MMKRVYKSMLGKEIDMDSLTAKHETVAAVGNVKVNARGDQLGPGGKIVKKKEELVNDFYQKNEKGKK